MVEWPFKEAVLIIIALLVAAIALTLMLATYIPLPDFLTVFLTSTSATIRGAVYGSPVTHKLTYSGWVPESLPLLGRVRGAWRINYDFAKKQNVTTVYRCFWNNLYNVCEPALEDYKNKEFCDKFKTEENCDNANTTTISPWKLLVTAVARESATCWGMYGGKGDPLFPGGYGKDPKICSILLYDLTNNFTEDGQSYSDINGLPGVYEGRWLNKDGIVEYKNVEDLIFDITRQKVSGKTFPEVVPEITSMGYGNWICGSRRKIEKVAKTQFCNKFGDYRSLSCQICKWVVEDGEGRCEPNIDPSKETEISDKELEEWNYYCNATDEMDADDAGKEGNCTSLLDNYCEFDGEKCVPKKEIKRGFVECPLDCTIPLLGGYCSDTYKHGSRFAGGGPKGNCIYTGIEGMEGTLRPPSFDRNEYCQCTVESNMKLKGDDKDKIAVAAPLTKGRIFVTFLDMWNNEDLLFDTRPIKFGNSVCGVVEVQPFYPALRKTDKILLCIQDDSWVDPNTGKWGRPVDPGDENKGKYGLIVTNTGGETPGGLGCMMNCGSWQMGHPIPKWFDCSMLTVEEPVVQFFTSAANKWAQTFEAKPYCVLVGIFGCFFL